MGTKVAPTYANLFMDVVETKFLQTTTLKPLVWKRFIDDIFAVWPGTTADVTKVLEELNTLHHTIKFTAEVSQKEVTFLDLTLHQGDRFRREGILDIKPHFKQTNKFQYLHYASSHPRSLFSGIAKGELTRMLRNSSDQRAYQEASNHILGKLRARGYPSKLLREALARLPFAHRHAVLKDKDIGTDRPLPFVCQYAERIPKSTLRNTLDQGPPELRPTLAFTRGTTLANSLVRARIRGTPRPPASQDDIKITQQPTFGSYSAPCSTPMCLCCAIMSKRTTIFATDQKTWAKCPVATNCGTSNCVYALQCKMCNKQNIYVGQTSRPLRERISGHRAAYRNNKAMPIYRHLAKPGHYFSSLMVTVLEKDVHPSRLLQTEADWIDKLSTRWPSGLNSKYDRPPD